MNVSNRGIAAGAAIVAASAIAVVPAVKPDAPGGKTPPTPVATVVDATGTEVPGAYLDNGVRVLKDGSIFHLDWQEGQPWAVIDMRQVDRFQLGGFKDAGCSELLVGWAQEIRTFEDNVPSGAMVSITDPIDYNTGVRPPLYRLDGPVEHVYEGSPGSCTFVTTAGPYMIVEEWVGEAPSATGPLTVELR